MVIYAPAMTRPRAPRMTSSARRHHLMEIAIQLLADEGLEALRMDRLATEAGVTRPVVYDHFDDREGLILAVMQHLMLEVGLALAEADATAAANYDFAAALAATTKAYFDVVGKRGRALRAFVLVEGITPAVDAGRQQLMSMSMRPWVQRTRRHTGLSIRDAEAVVGAQFAALFAIANRWLTGSISRRRAEQIFVTSTLGALEALRKPTASRS
jgi:AcrR family transcriptional regulator